MDGLQEQICAGCEFYEDNYKKALDRFLLYKEKIICTQTLIQKYEKRKQHNQQLLMKLQKSRQSVTAVRERFMHYMERYMPLEKSYSELKAAHTDLEDKMRTQSTTLIALQQHNKQLSALVEVQEKGVNEQREKSEKLEEELKRKVRINQIAKAKADDKYRSLMKSAVELAVHLKDKGMLPDSYKLCLKSWKKQLSLDIKPENCGNGGHSPDKASSISSQDTGFDSSKSMSDDENPFDENVMRRKGAAGDKRCTMASKTAAPSIPLETSISDKSANTSDVVRNFSTSRATQNFQNIRDIGVNTSLSMLTSDLSKCLHEVTVGDCKNSRQSPSEQGMEDHNFEPLPFDTDSQMINPRSHRASIFSPVKGAVHSASAEMPPTSAEKPPTSVEMPPSNDCVEEYQSNDEIPTNNAAVSASLETCSTDLKANVLSSMQCDSFQADSGVSQTCSNNNSVFQQQPVQAGNMKRRNLTLLGKRSSAQKQSISNKTHDPDKEEINQDCKTEIKPLKRVCLDECSSKYSSVLARFSIGNDVSSKHHSPMKAKMTNPKTILPDPKYTNIFTHDFVKSLDHFTSIIRSKTFLKYAKKNNCQRSLKLRKNILKTVRSPKKHFAANKPSSSYSNVVETASGCFLETVNDTPVSIRSVERTPKSRKFEDRLTLTETVKCRHEESNAAVKVSKRKRKISSLQCKTGMLGSKKQQKKGRSHLRLMVSEEVEKSRRHLEKNILQHETFALTHVTQKQVEHKESLMSDIVAHDFEPEMDNQTVNSLEKDKKDAENVAMLNSIYNCKETVSSSAIPETLNFSTNNNSTELKRKDSDNVSCLGYTVLLDDLSVSDDNSSPESIKDNSELSQCIQAERSDDECGSDSDVTSNNFPKTDVPLINNATKSELLKMNHDIIGSEKSCDKQCCSKIIEEVSGHSNARYFIPQVVNSNESVVKYEMVETDISIECSQEICVADQSVDLLDQKCDNESKVQKINLISEAGESISEISTCLSASCNTDGRTTNNVEVSCTHLNSGSDGSTSEVATVNEKELELISVSSSKNCTDTLAQPDIAADCTTQSSVSANTEDGTMDYADVLNDHNTMIFIPGSEVNTDKDVAKQDRLSPSDCANKEIDSADTTQDMYNVDSELSKDFSEIQKCTNEIVNQSECKDVKDTELLTVKSGLQKGLMKDATIDHQKNCNIDVNGKSEKELQEEIAHPNSLLKEDLFTRKSLINCSESEALLIKEQQELLTVKSGLLKGLMKDAISDQQENCNIDVNGKSEKELEEEITHPNSLLKEDLFTRRLLINGSESAAPLIKEQQESNKDDIPVEKIPQTELDISKQEGKDITEAYCEEYYMPPRTKKRIAHKPKPQASGSEICSEDKNFKIPIKAVRKRTPRKTKPETEDELRPSGSEICSEDKNFKSPIKAARKQTPRKTKQKIEDELSNIKSVSKGAQNSSKKLGHTVNEIDNMKEESSLEPKCSNSEVTENVNCVSEAKKLNTEIELSTDADSIKRRQLKARIDHKQLEPPSTHLQATRRSDRLKKVETLKLWQRLNVYAVKRGKKLKDEKCSTSDSIQEMVSVKTENSDDGPSSPDMDHVKKEKCDINEALLAGEPVPTVENSKVEKLHNLEDDTDDGAVELLIRGNKRRIKTETGDESSRKKLAPNLFKKPSCYQTEFENEASCPVSSNPSEDAPQVSCKSEIQSLCLVPFLSDKNKCKEECADVNMATLTSQEHNKCGSVISSESRTSLEETRCNNDTGHSNGEHVHVHNNSESNVTLDGINVSYAKGDIIRKCLAIQQRNKLAARRPTRKKFNEQQVFVYQQLSELLEGDFTNEVLNTALENFGQDVDAIALVRCVLKTLLQEDCNEIDRRHDIRAPPLSVVEEKLMTLMITLRNRCTKFSTLINDFLTAVEYYILNLRTTPEYDVLHILTRFHTALCKAEGLRERAQAFCYDALYCLKRKCFPIIYTVLTYYPEVFPRASLGMTSPLCVCIVYSIFTSMNDANNTYLKIKPLITLLCRIYDYKLEEVLSGDLVDCFLKHLKCQTSKSGEVCAAVTLLAKRKDRAWTISQLIPKYIAPIIQEWRHGKINEAVMGGVIDLIGCVVKPFTEQCDLGPILKIFKGILLADKVTQTLKMKAALSLARQASHHFSEVAPILYEWEPEGELPNEFWEQMSDILSVKPHTFWTSFLTTCEENSD